MLAKLSEGVKENWDLFLNQALAAARFSINETSTFSPFYIEFDRDVVLPTDNLLKPQKKYMGEDFHRIMIEKQHSIFVKARNGILRTKKKRNERVSKNRSEMKFEVGDPVFHKEPVRQGNLDQRQRPYYRIIEQTGAVTIKIWDQLRNKKKNMHANDIKRAGYS